MRYIFILMIFVGAGFLSAPQSTHALSCVDPVSMIEYYQSEPSYIIFAGIAGETKEFDAPGLEDAFTVGASGYTGQFVNVSTVYKGSIQDSLWVYHQKDATWGYLCSSGPVTEGESALFIVDKRSGTLELTTVVNTYSIDSELAQYVIEAVDTGTDESITYPFSATNWKQDLAREIKEAIFLLRIKFAEWRFWNAV